MIVIGFDPGSISFGVGILKKENKEIVYIHSEEIKLTGKDFYAKMRQLLARLDIIYESFPVDYASMEEVFLGKNVKSLKILSQVKGLVLASLIKKNIKLSSYSTREVKRALTGNGNALKSQVKKWIEILWNLENRDLGNDECDALAVAYCHLSKMK